MPFKIHRLSFKKISFLAVLTLLTLPVFSQTIFLNSDKQIYCTWDSTKHTFTDCVEKDDSSLFEINSNQTTFKEHTTKKTSSYFVKDHQSDDKNNQEIYHVLSDAGNQYTFVLDFNQNVLNVVSSPADGQVFSLSFHIKNNWTTSDK